MDKQTIISPPTVMFVMTVYRHSMCDSIEMLCTTATECFERSAPWSDWIDPTLNHLHAVESLARERNYAIVSSMAVEGGIHWTLEIAQ